MRTVVYIDGAYLSKAVEFEFNTKIDLEKFSRNICGNHYLQKVTYYTCLPYVSGNSDEAEMRKFENASMFIQALSNIPNFEVKLGKLIRNVEEQGYKQKMVDVKMAVDMVLTKNAERVVVVTGDLDFAPAIDALRERGILVELYYNPKNVYPDLLMKPTVSIAITKDLVLKSIFKNGRIGKR